MPIRIFIGVYCKKISSYLLRSSFSPSNLTIYEPSRLQMGALHYWYILWCIRWYESTSLVTLTLAICWLSEELQLTLQPYIRWFIKYGRSQASVFVAVISLSVPTFHGSSIRPISKWKKNGITCTLTSQTWGEARLLSLPQAQ